jgi:4-aminobutyrate aminotransferase
MTWPKGAHGNTYGGNPISCAASLATIELLEESYLANAAEVGQYALDALQEIQMRHPSIGDVRGKGLMIGVEFVKNKETKEPDEELRNKIEEVGFEHGLLLLGCGKSTIRLAPPLCITKNEMDEALEIFEETITMTEQRLEMA